MSFLFATQDVVLRNKPFSRGRVTLQLAFSEPMITFFLLGKRPLIIFPCKGHLATRTFAMSLLVAMSGEQGGNMMISMIMITSTPSLAATKLSVIM